MDSSRISNKNRSQIEKEVSKAQAKLMQIFFKDLEDKMDCAQNIPPQEIPGRGKSTLQAYNKFNDENYSLTHQDICKLTSKDPEQDKKKVKPIKSLNDDPVVKSELSKNKYANLVELNRDFHFYINHPEKCKKITRAKLKSNFMRRTDGDEMSDLPLDENHNDYGLLAQSRDIMKSIEQSRAHGYMSIKERKKLLKNLF
jgi:hypothetical protein